MEEEKQVQLVSETTDCPKEVNDLRLAIAKVVKTSKEVSADGFQLTTDVPQVLLASMQELIAAINGLDKVSIEVKRALPEFIACMGLLGRDIAKELA